MDRDGVLQALEAGNFDGISHSYEPYAGYGKTTHQISMSVSGGTIELTKTTRGKFFDGRENTRYADSSTEYLIGGDAVDFIAQRPYYFSLARPDLFYVEEERIARADVEAGFVARYPGTCARCGGPIEPGQEIQTYSAGRYERYEHVVCPRSAALAEKRDHLLPPEEWSAERSQPVNHAAARTGSSLRRRNSREHRRADAVVRGAVTRRRARTSHRLPDDAFAWPWSR